MNKEELQEIIVHASDSIHDANIEKDQQRMIMKMIFASLCYVFAILLVYIVPLTYLGAISLGFTENLIFLGFTPWDILILSFLMFALRLINFSFLNEIARKYKEKYM